MPIFSRFILPGSLLNTVTAFLAIFSFVIATAFTIKNVYLSENWIVLHAGITVVSAITLKITLRYDPRKPLPDYMWVVYERKFCIFLHLFEEEILYLWLWSIKMTKLDYQVTIENVLVVGLVISRFVYFMWFYHKELNEHSGLTVTFPAGLDFFFFLVKTCIVLTAMLKANQGFVEFLLFVYKISYPIYTVFILAVFCGLYRESVRQLPVQVQVQVQVQAQARVQIPQPVVLESRELEREPPSHLEIV